MHMAAIAHRLRSQWHTSHRHFYSIIIYIVQQVLDIQLQNRSRGTVYDYDMRSDLDDAYVYSITNCTVIIFD